MVATAAASAFFPVASPSPGSGAKTSSKLGGNLGVKSKSTSGGLQVKASAQAPPKINGTSVGVMVDGIKNENDTPSPPPRTFINQLPDWSMLLAAITTVFLAAEKQWMMLDWKPRRSDMLVDPFGLGRIVEDGLVFRQNFSIRSYEIGADRTASIETLMNHLQETALNHVKTAGLLGDGFGSTPEMCKKNLIWVVARMQVLVDRYPTWGDVVQVDTWVSRSGKNGMRREWLLRDGHTGETLTRASSVWVMMNKITRKISKIPDEVRGEIEPYFMGVAPVVEEDSRKLGKLDDKTADYVRTGLTPRWSDLDVNQHVNNVKYIGWILEAFCLLDAEIATMLKQFLSRLPRKSSKSEPPGSASSGSNNNLVRNSIQHAKSSDAVSSQSDAIKRMSSAVCPAGAAAGSEAAELYLSFNDVPNSEKQSLFISKLNLCCMVFDFNDPDKCSAEKDLKHQALIELVNFVASGSARLTEPAIATMCKMCAVNLFRVFPPKNRTSGTCGEKEDEEPTFDPSWSHLQVVYDLLLRFVSCTSLDVKLAKKYIDHYFVLRLLDLFDSEDPRERDCLKTILHRVYGKFMVHRPFIRKAVSNIIYHFVFETERHNGIAELLEIFGSVISGFALPLKEEHKMFLWKALIPLHKPKSVGIYHQQLTYCVVQYIEKDLKLAGTVIKGLLKFWPVTNSQKELMFLSELEEILEMTNIAEFETIMVPIFRRIKCCLNSSHFQVAERALFLCNNENILNLITPYRHVIVPLVFPALEWNTQNHWNQAVLNLTLNARKMFHDMDEELILACQGKSEEEYSKSNLAAEKRRLAWERLETAVRFQLVDGNISIRANPATCSVSC